MIQQVKLLLMMPASHIAVPGPFLADALLLTWFFANMIGKLTENGPSIWTHAILMGDQN